MYFHISCKAGLIKFYFHTVIQLAEKTFSHVLKEAVVYLPAQSQWQITTSMSSVTERKGVAEIWGERGRSCRISSKSSSSQWLCHLRAFQGGKRFTDLLHFPRVACSLGFPSPLSGLRETESKRRRRGREREGLERGGKETLFPRLQAEGQHPGPPSGTSLCQQAIVSKGLIPSSPF